MTIKYLGIYKYIYRPIQLFINLTIIDIFQQNVHNKN